MQSEAGPAASSSSRALAAVAGSTDHGWLVLGEGTTGAAPCDHSDCEACTAAPGCGWCAERHTCMQGGDEGAPRRAFELARTKQARAARRARVAKVIRARVPRRWCRGRR
eukprot:6533790-Prymnesium_polylepis.1